MKITLIFPDISSFHNLPYHPGLASIAAVLISHGHEVRLNYLNRVRDMKDTILQIKAFDPQIVGFTAVETQFRYVKQLAREIKKVSNSFIVCGGAYVTLMPEVLLEENSPLDAVIRGEGESAFLDLVKSLEKGEDWTTIHNLAYKSSDGNVLLKNILNPLIDNLDKLPYPNTELFPYQDIIDRENIAMFHFNRGCPYHCTFCSNEALGKLYGMSSNRVRMRSVENVMDEIENTLRKYKLHDCTVLHFSDDLFIFNKEWTLEFCSIYKKKFRRPFWCTGRCNYITDDICKALKDAGCVALMMSVESGNDYIRNEVMRRNISRETLFKSFELCHKYGINTIATCIIGFPSETPQMIEDSIKNVAQLRSISAYGINIFYPYKGTHLRKLCEEKNMMRNDIGDDFIERKESALILPDLPQKKLLYYYNNWIPLIMRHKKLMERLKFSLWGRWNKFRTTLLGKIVRFVINETRLGNSFKLYMMKRLWNINMGQD